ncbi:MAG: dihydroorotase [Clostridiales bacterium]|nr:dihydroorotase [Clostridiales bacterium]
MDLLLSGGCVYLDGGFVQRDVAISKGRIISVSPSVSPDGFSVIELHHCLLVPGFVDVHVHLREPGFSYKETIASGTDAAARGGYTDICAMPNLKPVPDCMEALQIQRHIIDRDARIHVHPYGAITRGQAGTELADMAAIAPYVVGFSDDGRGVQSEEQMRRAMEHAAALRLPIVAHCEDNALLTPGWCVHEGDWARRHGLPGSSSQSEWKQLERDLRLVAETGCRYHACHISTKESVALIRNAKAAGLPVSCETAPHYLLLCEDNLQDSGSFKMNPPLRSKEDRDALRKGLLDGTIDCIATDHAPHSAAEKAGGLRESLNGIVGLETAFQVLYTYLVKTGLVPLAILLDRLCCRPRQLFGLPGGKVETGEPASLTVLNLDDPHTVDATAFASMGRATPFDGWQVSASVAATFCDGRLVYAAGKENNAL